MKDALRDGVSTIAEFVPEPVLFLVIVVVGIGRALSSSKADASDIVATLIHYTFGDGLIRQMQQRWESRLTTAWQHRGLRPERR